MKVQFLNKDCLLREVQSKEDFLSAYPLLFELLQGEDPEEALEDNYYASTYNK